MQDDEVVRLNLDFGDQSFNKTFGDRVRKARGELKWSQRKLAEELVSLGVKLDPSAVTRIERGHREVKLREAAGIAAALRRPLQDLSPSPNPSPREQFMSCIQLAVQYGGEARQSLATMSMFIASAVHLAEDHDLDLLSDLIGDQRVGATTADILAGISQAVSKVVAQTPAAHANDAEQARLLEAVVNAVVSNLIGVADTQTEEHQNDPDT